MSYVRISIGPSVCIEEFRTIEDAMIFHINDSSKNEILAVKDIDELMPSSGEYVNWIDI